MAHIGIKLADGSFYPILDEDSAARKAMVVTTVKDRQPSVRINLYKAEDGTASTGMLYVGSLLIEDLPPQARGGPDIRLELSLDEAGELHVEASEKTTGASQSLSVSLGDLAPPADDELPDFDLGDTDDATPPADGEPPISLVGDDLDSDFPKLDDELPSLDDETPEPDTIDNGMDNLDSEFPSLDNDLPTMDEEMPSLDDEVPNLDDDQTDTSSDGNMDDFNLSAADGLDTSPYNDDSNDEPSAEDFESAAAAAANENFDMPDDFTLADNPPPDEFSSAADDFDTAADDNPTPLEVPLTATAQRPVRTRREAAPANDSDLSLDHKRRGLPVWLRIVLILVSLAALLGLAFVVFRCVADRTPPIPDATALQPLPPLVVPTLPPLTPPPVTTPAVTTPPPETTPAVTTPPVATTPVVTPAVSAETTPPETTAPRGDRPPTTPREPGVWYRLRWGDTLWDLSNSYYRNPWQYMKIFRANPDIIVHPDRIIATTWIYIPK